MNHHTVGSAGRDLTERFVLLTAEPPSCLQTEQNPEAGRYLPRRAIVWERVCVGLAPHHLMFEIMAQATQKAEGIF